MARRPDRPGAPRPHRLVARGPAGASGRRPGTRLAGGLLIATFLVSAVALGYWKGGERGRPVRAGAPRAVAFVDDRACASCHQEPFREWSGSHHDLAMQAADARSILGDFKDTRFTHFGVTSRFLTRHRRFFVNTDGPDGRPADFEVRYTLGVAPLQQYLVELAGGRLQALTIAWDARRSRWFSLYPGVKIAPGDPLHWTQRYQNWNLMCAECHTTNLTKGYDGTSDTYRTTWSAGNVGCQACHGPGGDHVTWARTGGNGSASGLVVGYRRGGSREEVDACAACHSRRTRIATGEGPGRPLYDTFRPEPLRAGLYYADGQQLDEVYEYGSFRQSKMYQRGVRCTDCHNPHSGKLRAEGNAVCTQCHRPEGNPRFPTLAAKAYDTTAHHFHKAGRPGARCVDCHMPAKASMIVDSRRDHTLRPPRPDLSVRIGTPNACTDCHRDRSAEWAASAVVKWYGPLRPKGLDWALAVAAGRARAPDGARALVAVAGDREQLPAIVRASALDLLRVYGPQGVAAMTASLQDDDPAVRVAAVAGLEAMPAGERVAAASPLLTDPVRAVRIEAARVLAGVSADHFTAAQRRALDAGVAEFVEAQVTMADMPASHLDLARLYASQGKRNLAEAEYLIALRMDPYFGAARANLAMLYNAMGRDTDAERVLREGIARTPNEGEFYYSLGLLLAEERRLAEAAEALGHAARLMPRRARVRYNLALAFDRLGQGYEAEAALLRASQLDPRDPDILYATAMFYVQRQHWQRALPFAERLAATSPGDPRAHQLLKLIKTRLAPSS